MASADLVQKEIQRAFAALQKAEARRIWMREYQREWVAEKKATDPEWVSQQKARKREYMREYMRGYKAKKRAEKWANEGLAVPVGG